MDELATAQDMSEPSLIGFIVEKVSPKIDLINDSYWNPTLRPAESNAKKNKRIGIGLKPFFV